MTDEQKLADFKKRYILREEILTTKYVMIANYYSQDAILKILKGDKDDRDKD